MANPLNCDPFPVERGEKPSMDIVPAAEQKGKKILVNYIYITYWFLTIIFSDSKSTDNCNRKKKH